MLILVRHGRTALNAARRLQGRIDEPLDGVGEEQAKAVAAHVGPVDELICSPLRRARQTADAFGIDYDIDERWIEVAYGVYEGAEVASTPAELWRRWRRDPAYVPEEGESLATVAARVRAACEELADRPAGHTVAVVTHVSPIKAAVGWALGAGPEVAWRSRLAPASVCRIDLSAPEPVLESFNELAG